MIEVKKCLGKGFGWICALNRWSVQEHAQTSFCPVALRYCIIWHKTVQADNCLSPEQIDTLFISVGGQEGGFGGGVFWAGGLKFTHDCILFFVPSCLPLHNQVPLKQTLSSLSQAGIYVDLHCG